MKNTLLAILLFASFPVFAQTGTTGSTKPVSNTDLPTNSSQSNNSNSGVNPAGNPGTIINSTTNSNSANQGLIQPVGVPPAPAYYNLPPDTLPIRARISAKADSGNMVINADTVTSQAYVPGDSILPEPVMTPADAPIIADTQNIVTSGVAPEGNIATTGMATMSPSGYSETILIGLSRYASLPVLSTWVPENIVSQLSSRFSNGLYDITMVRSSKDENKHHYIVRTQDNGIFTTHVITDME